MSALGVPKRTLTQPLCGTDYVNLRQSFIRCTFCNKTYTDDATSDRSINNGKDSATRCKRDSHMRSSLNITELLQK